EQVPSTRVALQHGGEAVGERVGFLRERAEAVDLGLVGTQVTGAEQAGGQLERSSCEQLGLRQLGGRRSSCFRCGLLGHRALPVGSRRYRGGVRASPATTSVVTLSAGVKRSACSGGGGPDGALGVVGGGSGSE